MSREQAAARRAAGMETVYIPVSHTGMESGDMDDAAPAPPDMDAVHAGIPQFKRDITDGEWIAYMAVARKDGKHRFSANQIHAAVGGDRNTVLARVREIREIKPPAEYFQPDGSKAPATDPVTSGKSLA
jgi:hypothetical protein